MSRAPLKNLKIKNFGKLLTGGVRSSPLYNYLFFYGKVVSKSFGKLGNFGVLILVQILLGAVSGTSFCLAKNI